MGIRCDDVPRRRNDTSRPGRNSRRVGAPGARDSGRVDDSPPARPPPGRRAAARSGELVRHNAADLRPGYQGLANSVERPSDELFHAANRAWGRHAHRADGRGSERRVVAMTFSEIEPDSFHWTAEHAPDNRTWRREVDIRARR